MSGPARIVDELIQGISGEAKMVSTAARAELEALERAGARLPARAPAAEGEGLAAAGSEAEAQVIREGAEQAQVEINSAAKAARQGENAAVREGEAANSDGVRAQMDRVPEPVGWGTSLKKFALKCGVEIGKGGLMAVGMEAVSTAWKAIEKSIENAEKAKRSQKLDTFIEAWKGLQAIKDEWSKWMLSRYNLRETYGSITTPTHFTILNYMTVQGQLDSATNYPTTTVAKAIDLAKVAATPDAMEKANAILLTVGIKFAELIDAANTTIKDQPKMLLGGLKEHGTDMAASKKKTTDVYTDEDKKKATISDIEGA